MPVQLEVQQRSLLRSHGGGAGAAAACTILAASLPAGPPLQRGRHLLLLWRALLLQLLTRTARRTGPRAPLCRRGGLLLPQRGGCEVSRAARVPASLLALCRASQHGQRQALLRVDPESIRCIQCDHPVSL